MSKTTGIRYGYLREIAKTTGFSYDYVRRVVVYGTRKNEQITRIADIFRENEGQLKEKLKAA